MIATIPLNKSSGCQRRKKSRRRKLRSIPKSKPPSLPVQALTPIKLVLGELVIEEKSNEIAAVPELLDSINVEGSIVTADAMSCQKTIVQKIQDGKADYVIGLKGNQPSLLENISLYFQDFSKDLHCLVTRDKDHGRIEKREYRLLTDLSWLPEHSESYRVVPP